MHNIVLLLYLLDQGFTAKLPLLINDPRQAGTYGRYLGSHYTKFNHPFLGKRDTVLL